VAISGEPDVFNERITFQPKDWERLEEGDLTHTGRLVPVYPLTRGLFQKSLRALVRRIVEEYACAVEDHLSGDTVESLHLPSLELAIEQYHFPDDEEQKAWAEQRLAFDELLMIQLGLLQRKQEWQQPLPGVAIAIDDRQHEVFCRSLPFDLTGAQRRVTGEILGDMSRPVPMSRLLQGDVGSGKTVVAAAALLQSVGAGKQGVLMAPTEILAEQHFRTLSALLAPFDVRCDLLIGSTTRTEKRRIYEATRTGEAQVVVGTHALIQEGLEFADLGLAITDEQHRFGVEQRATLRQKGLHPHILAMTATPIPRTLAMTIYGDLDVSVIDEMPPGRLPIVTTWCRTPAEAYGVVRDEVRGGRQAFVICPVIEESMERDMRSVIAEHKELQNLVFPDLEVALLHGRMRPAEKESTLDAFRRGEYHVLVATSVVEVGIDVPNATVMVIRDAHRFGLAQLHQFRGRVGRGGEQAYCILLSASESDEARERLEALTATENGFELAEEDLRLRGPGEFWGVRQSGLPELKVARLGDLPTIDLARRAAGDILQNDPRLEAPESEALRRQVKRFWETAADLS
jgi:ATP-dependent DNA helicase RecG